VTRGLIIRSARLAASLTRDQLAAALGWPTYRLASIEQGRSPGRPEDLAALARALGLDLAKLAQASQQSVRARRGRPRESEYGASEAHGQAVARALHDKPPRPPRVLSAAHLDQLERYALVRGAGLTREQIARVFGVSVSTVYRWERDLRSHLATQEGL